MTANPKLPPSFSPGRRWKIGFDTLVRTALVLAVVVMINYLGGLFSKRFYLSSQTRTEISSRTVDVLRSLTNQVSVTLYYDTGEDLYPTILSLLNAYHAVNPNVSIRTVDYVRNAGEAEKIKAQYKLNSPTDKNLIIFDSGSGRLPKIIPGDALAKYTMEQVPNEKEHEFRKKPVAFLVEIMFTSALLALENSKPFKAYFLQGHGEPSLADSDESSYLKFAGVLGQNYIQVEPLALLGDSSIPDDCNLLIIAGPRTMLSNPELQKIEQYLSQGGRLFLLLNYASIQHPTGLEDIVRHWGVNVGNDVVQDPENTVSSGQDVIVYNFSQHPVVNPLTRLALRLILPRPVSRIDWQNPPADAPKVDELAFSGPASVLMNQRGVPPHSYPLMAAVEQNEVKGLANTHGGCRMVVVGDSLFLDNQLINNAANSDFVSYAANWLLDRPALLKGIGPRPVVEFRLVMTRQQQHQIRWLLLGALPCSVLMLGGLVWLRRRK